MVESNISNVNSNAPFLVQAMNIIGGKWKIVILYQIRSMPKRYSELLREIDGITEMTLSLQLRQLEKDGLINRNVSVKQSPIKVFYGLTDFGNSLIPSLEMIADWAGHIVPQKTTSV